MRTISQNKSGAYMYLCKTLSKIWLALINMYLRTLIVWALRWSFNMQGTSISESHRLSRQRVGCPKFLCIKTTTMVIKTLVKAGIRHHCEGSKVVERVRLVYKLGIKLRILHAYPYPVIGVEVKHTTHVGGISSRSVCPVWRYNN